MLRRPDLDPELALAVICWVDGSHFTASEYIAAVAQLETLSATLQTRLRENYRGLEGFAAASEISITYFLLDPARFAVKSWLHYRAPGHVGSGERRPMNALGLTHPQYFWLAKALLSHR